MFWRFRMKRRILECFTVVMAISLFINVETSRSQTSVLRITPGDRNLTLNWQSVDPGSLSHYELYRRVYNGYIRVEKTATSFTDQRLDNGLTYYYSLIAVNTDVSKREIAGRTAGTPIDLAPASPEGFRANGRDGQVRLRWALNSEPDLARYVVYRTLGDATGPGTLIATYRRKICPIWIPESQMQPCIPTHCWPLTRP